MKLYTINATPVRTKEQWRRQMPTSKILTDKVVDGLNTMAIEVYPGAVAKILAEFDIDGFTMYEVKGYWKGIPEVSFKIEVALDDNTNSGGANADATMVMVADELKIAYNQEGVMLTLPNNTVKFI